MTKRPLFWVAAAFVVGIVLSGVGGVPFAVGLSALAFGCLCAMIRGAFGIAALFTIAAVSMLRYDTHMILPRDDVSKFLRTRTTGVIGRVVSDVDLRPDRARFPISVSSVETGGRWIQASGRLMVTYYRPDDIPDWRAPVYGDVLRIRARISRPSTASNSGSFSWRDYLSRQRIHAVTYVRSTKQVTRLANRAPNLLAVLAIRARERLARTVAASMPADEAAVVTGMALGTYTALPDRLLSNFQKTGTLHLLAASGFNCAVLVAVFGFVLTRIRIPRRLIHPTLIMILVFYMLMVGAKPSIVRATVMATMLLMGAVFRRPGDSINLLFAAVVIILAINPADIFDIGFQLSFAAVLALIIVLGSLDDIVRQWRLMPKAEKYRPDSWHKAVLFISGETWLGMYRRRVWDLPTRAAMFLTREGWQGLTATAAATMGTLPLSAHYFNQLSIVSVVVNAIVAATVLPIFVIGLLLPMLSWVPVLGDALSFTGTQITRFALSSINWFGEIPNSCLSIRSPGFLGIAGYYILLAAALKYVYSKLPTRKRAGSS